MIQPVHRLAAAPPIVDAEYAGNIVEAVTALEEELVRTHAGPAVRSHVTVQIGAAVAVGFPPCAAVAVNPRLLFYGVVARRMDEVDPKTRVPAALVREEIGDPFVAPDEQVREAVAVVIRPERSPAIPRLDLGRSRLLDDVAEEVSGARRRACGADVAACRTSTRDGR
jgi:hypothetical protein